jgi:hypothetical protein
MKLVLFFCDELPGEPKELMQSAAMLVKIVRPDLIEAVVERNETAFRRITGLIPLLSTVQACSGLMMQTIMRSVLFDSQGTVLVLVDHARCNIRAATLSAQPLEPCLENVFGVLGRAAVNTRAWFDISRSVFNNSGKLVIIESILVHDDDGDIILTTKQDAKHACQLQILGEIPTQLA